MSDETVHRSHVSPCMPRTVFWLPVAGIWSSVNEPKRRNLLPLQTSKSGSVILKLTLNLLCAELHKNAVYYIKLPASQDGEN